MIRYWWAACRPRTLPIAMTPVVVGAALAWVARGGTLNAGVWWLTLLAAVLLQVATNLHNDAADGVRGLDQPAARIGPPRVTAAGWLSARQVQYAARGCFMLALGLGVALVAIGGLPILLIGLAALAAGYGYSGGPRPLAASALGELYVWLFFGVAAVAGTYYLQTGRVDPGALRAGALLGLLAAAVLAVNNHRDRDSDRIAGRRTLALRLGPQATRGLYALLILGPFLLVPTLQLQGLGPWSWLLPELALPWALRLAVRFWRTGGTGLNAVLVATVHLELYFGLLLALGVVLDHTPP